MFLGTSSQDIYGNRFRRARFESFMKMIDAVIAEKGQCSVLDVGGEMAHWAPHEDLWRGKPIKVVIVNLKAEPVSEPFTSVAGDARTLEQFGDGEFDIVYSNSVIEHVGQWSDQKQMAAAIARVAKRHYVQTPNYWFPLEPHFRYPFIHWLPEPWRVALVKRRARGCYPKAEDVSQARDILQDAILLDEPAMASLFPDSQIEREKVGPLTKSLIAVRA